MERIGAVSNWCPMNMTDAERRAMEVRLAEVQENLRAIEAQVNLTKWKELFKEKLRLERRLAERDSGA